MPDLDGPDPQFAERLWARLELEAFGPVRLEAAAAAAGHRLAPRRALLLATAAAVVVLLVLAAGSLQTDPRAQHELDVARMLPTPAPTTIVDGDLDPPMPQVVPEGAPEGGVPVAAPGARPAPRVDARPAPAPALAPAPAPAPAPAVEADRRGAAPRQGTPHVVDPRGDWPVPAQDIIAATFSTTGSGAGAALQIRLDLAGPPATDAALYWEVGWSTSDCALNYIEYTRSAYGPGVVTAELIRQCQPGGPKVNGGPATGRLQGSTIILSTPLSRRYPLGTLITSPFASSYGFYNAAPGVPTWYVADETEKGRSYRVGAA